MPPPHTGQLPGSKAFLINSGGHIEMEGATSETTTHSYARDLPGSL